LSCDRAALAERRFPAILMAGAGFRPIVPCPAGVARCDVAASGMEPSPDVVPAAGPVTAREATAATDAAAARLARKQASVSTRKGDGGTTRLGGGEAISKADARVEAYGAIDELNTTIGLARTLSSEPEVAAAVREIQRELFVVGSAISTKPDAKKPIPEITKEMVRRLDALVERWEAEPNILRDWSIPGEYRESAAYDMARATCRRAERASVRYVTSGGAVQPTVLEYLNRLSDVLWLAARVIEARAGIDARLRTAAHPGPPWSRAW